MTCSLCDRPVRARGWCITHYMRWHRWGDPQVSHRSTRSRPDEPTEHGTYYAYIARGCRCDPCRNANRRHRTQWRRANFAALTPGSPVHGTENGYTNHLCRCFPCCLAKSKADAAYRERRAS